MKEIFKATKPGSIEYRILYHDENDIRRIKSFTAPAEKEDLQRADRYLKKNEMKLMN